MYNTLFAVLPDYLAVKDDEAADTDELLSLAKELAALDTGRMENRDARAIAEAMQKDIYDRVAEPAYTLGRKAYDNEDYVRAAEYLQAAYDYGFRNDYAYYYLGKAYQLMNDYERAAEYYRLLLSEYPSSDLAGYTRTRLGEMGMEE